MPPRAPDETHIGIAQRTELAAVRAVIIAGLTQRWRSYSAAANPDLEAFESNYESAVIVVAKVGDEIIGCGILIPETPNVGRIVRMSVATARQRSGIGGKVLRELLDRARQAGYSQVVLETSAHWHSAVRFYERYGFVPTQLRDGDQHFCFDLDAHRR